MLPIKPIQTEHSLTAEHLASFLKKANDPISEIEAEVMRGEISNYLTPGDAQAILYALVRYNDKQEMRFQAERLRLTASKFTDLANKLDAVAGAPNAITN